MPDEPREAVIRATCRALCTHGYANLTMQDIADETDLSKAALHYHYDTKRDLLIAFLDSLTSWYEGRLEDLEGETAPERLSSLFDECLSHDDGGDDDTDGDADYPAFHTALMEIKAQAPYDDAFRERLAAADEVLLKRVRGIVADGVAAGAFADVDPDVTAELVVDVLAGGHTRNVAVGRSLDDTRDVLDGYVDEHLLAADAHTNRGPDADAGADTEPSDAETPTDSTQAETEPEAGEAEASR
ncbi:TetR/AcrR family transcriptional regulator [Salinigranum sp. GCM10025319]|uniref:TetR/AcrR family transcriptional regulator n=1 Tax=Salinigranum sp. GCM10025319 TaxID=3252687 RepID=UPI00361BB4CA